MKCRNLRSRRHLGGSLFKSLHRRDRPSCLYSLRYSSVEPQQQLAAGNIVGVFFGYLTRAIDRASVC
ncbi:hypothetical protein [Microcoleus sp. herbarium14]|uniref:hypothetical protein n=1 Tax=Microcoleus sp. herbarium14 TaxID=3055439 RepID=UPI002FD1AA53